MKPKAKSFAGTPAINRVGSQLLHELLAASDDEAASTHGFAFAGVTRLFL
jgi:hypothetical protein